MSARPRLAASLPLLLALVLTTVSCSEDEDGTLRPQPLGPAPDPVADLRVTAGAAGSLTLAWTVPDRPDGATEGEILYELRHTAPGTEDGDFDGWTPTADPSPDDTPGQVHTVTVGGLTADRAYVFRLRARVPDSVWSEPSNVVLATAASDHDRTRPAPVAELRRWAGDGTSLTVAWAGAGDDSLYGAASEYAVRWHASATDWDAMTPAPGPVEPASKPGWWRTTLTGLTPEAAYRVRVRAADEHAHWSAPSAPATLTADTLRVWYVNIDGTGDAPTIEAAVDSAGSGDLILVGPGRYTWTNQGTGDPQYGIVHVKQNKVGFELRSDAGPEATIIDGEGFGPVIHVAGAVLGPGDEVPTWPGIVIDGFTLTGGVATGRPGVTGQAYAGGGLVFHLSNAVLRNLIVHGNRASQGGGIWFGGQGVPVIEDCRIFDNRAVTNSAYRDESGFGGGVLLVNDSFGVTMRGCEITGNEADRIGGGLACGAGSSLDFLLLTMEDCVVRGNTAEYGGGVYLSRMGEGSLLRDVVIADNVATIQGGGVYCAGVEATTTLANVTLTGNRCNLGSAIRLVSRSMLILDHALLAFNRDGAAFSAQSSSGVEAGCSVVFGHTDDAWPRDLVDLGGNFSADPRLCADGVTLRADSPCAPGNHPDGGDCGRIGAGAVGCP